MSQFIQRIKFPLKNVDIMPCSNFFCVCVEYLDFSDKLSVERYKQCMITNLKNNNVPPPPNILLKRSNRFASPPQY
tara:strand:+ start:1212 stop:1439 length:228 start_codon:yes stop_codon:yes gene_type:complete